MNITIRTRRLSLRPRLRVRIEDYLRTVLQREEGQVLSATLYISSTPLAGTFIGYACRLVLHARRAGQVVVSSEAPRLTAALRHVTRRGRAVLRQRSKQTVDRYHGVRAARQQSSQPRVEQWSS